MTPQMSRPGWGRKAPYVCGVAQQLPSLRPVVPSLPSQAGELLMRVQLSSGPGLFAWRGHGDGVYALIWYGAVTGPELSQGPGEHPETPRTDRDGISQGSESSRKEAMC